MTWTKKAEGKKVIVFNDSREDGGVFVFSNFNNAKRFFLDYIGEEDDKESYEEAKKAKSVKDLESMGYAGEWTEEEMDPLYN